MSHCLTGYTDFYIFATPPKCCIKRHAEAIKLLLTNCGVTKDHIYRIDYSSYVNGHDRQGRRAFCIMSLL